MTTLTKSTPIMYGISPKNCDTVKKARKWLEANGHTVPFHDFRVDGLAAEQLNDWVERIGFEPLLNKKSTSFRALTDEQKQDIDATKAVALMLDNPTLIKRPVLVKGDAVYTGFNDKLYSEVFGQ
ncbi:arsenate reductase [Shewanella sp.]|uniref:arsenate reductase n=1 Tax=Shewanella sp. TaxID=50422 RepID=UPI003561936C